MYTSLYNLWSFKETLESLKSGICLLLSFIKLHFPVFIFSKIISKQLNLCLQGVCKIYEEHLKRKHPDIPSITYDISQLFEFIDQVTN